jgi:uncharacterized protein (UPF0332 family)
MTTGDDFIALAGRLVAGPNPAPVALRTAVSRAYYGCYHLTHQLLSSLAIPPGERHNLHEYLCNSGNRDAEQAGKVLEDLYSRRRLADYKLDRTDIESPKFAQYAVELAHEFRIHLDKCRTESALGAMGIAIKIYRDKTKR